MSGAVHRAGRKTINNINITPNAGKLINSLRYLTYTNETAIADIIDNSFDAGADGVNVIIDDKHIIIVDDGYGMSQDIMKEAIKLGSDTSKEQSCLGKFGMGLVTASISMGRKLEVFSKTIDDDEPSKVVLDLDYIEETNNWVGISEPADDEEAKLLISLGHGTIVKISQLDSIKASIIPSLTKHLRLVFRNFLMAGREITVNGEVLTPIDPLNRGLNDTEILFDDDVEIKGENVHVVVAHIDTDKSDEATRYNDADHLKVGPATQGFYIVRNNREIAECRRCTSTRWSTRLMIRRNSAQNAKSSQVISRFLKQTFVQKNGNSIKSSCDTNGFIGKNYSTRSQIPELLIKDVIEKAIAYMEGQE